MRFHSSSGGAALAAALIFAFPSGVLACACGCGVFGVGTLPLVAPDLGGIAFLEYDFMDQNRNWNGSSTAPAANNPDKDLRTSFFTAGGEYMFDDDWGVMAEVPYWERHFATTGADGNVESFDHGSLGDIRLEGVYSGFSSDMSTGVVFGLKLPTGDFRYPGFDRDTEIGTGSTDLLLGGYHAGPLTADNAWSWFAQGQWEHAVAQTGAYRPGDEIDAALGVDYSKGVIVGQAAITPTLEFIASQRAHDSGAQSDRPDSGYARFFMAPGAELDVQAWKLYGAVEIPAMQHFNGNQLAANVLFKVSVGYSF
ncbi:MAG TPA: hypothetical protein VII49_02910 [Rhizomicrobium sp.]